MLNLLSGLNSVQGPAALATIAGTSYAGFGSVAVQSTQSFMNAFSTNAGGGQGSGRIALAEACDVACDTDTPRWSAWGGGIGGFGAVAGSSAAPGYTYGLGGFAAGLDHRFDPKVLAGVTVGFSSASLNSQNVPGSGTSNTVQFGLYGVYNSGALYIDGLGGYARADNYMTRPISFPGLSRTAQGQTHADQFFGQVETGYRVELGVANTFVTPFARLQAFSSTQAAFAETGADSLNLNVAQQTTNSLRSILGAQFGGEVEKLKLAVRLGWSHEYADLSRPVTASFVGAPTFGFTTYGATGPRDGVIVGLAASYAVGQSTSLYARYDGDFAGATSNNTLWAGVRHSW